jgi:hypothetical protein
MFVSFECDLSVSMIANDLFEMFDDDEDDEDELDDVIVDKFSFIFRIVLSVLGDDITDDEDELLILFATTLKLVKCFKLLTLVERELTNCFEFCWIANDDLD